ncbi:MAG TPA: hypothetical protein VG889_18745 [Rhizomicrobium sp.]|nr:hypothetical protein [Rhizomicrobium sp.]
MARSKIVSFVPVVTKIADDFAPSTYTPFTRRFTDERARSLAELRALYDEVRRMHYASPYAREDAVVAVCSRILGSFGGRVPEALQRPFSRTLVDLANLETTIFEFPEIKWDVAQLSLKQQVDLERYLTAKRHFLVNHERAIDFLQGGLYLTLDAITDAIPEGTADTSPFTIPLINAVAAPRKLLDRLYAILWNPNYADDGLFVEVTKTMHANLCAVSKIADPHDPKGRRYLIPSENDAPLEELVEAYFRNTPFYAFLMAPVPLRLTHEDRFSHMHIVGGSGAGKTQLLQNLILHDLRSPDPPALVIVDSQTDLIGKLSRLALLDPDTGPLAGRLLLITPRDIAHPPAINIFDVNRERLGGYDEATKEQVTAGVIQTFDYLFGGLLGADLTAKQGVFFRFVARLMLALPETLGRTATILDMISLMDDAAPYRKAIESLPPIQRNFFERDFASKTFAQTKEQIRYRLNAVLENPTLARLFTSPRTKIDLYSALNSGSIILVDTAKDFLKGSSAHFGRIFISLVLQAVLERAAMPEHERKPAFLIVDEAAEYFDGNIDDLLTEARKMKLGCIFAHQFLDQASSSLRSSLAANTAIKMASGVSMSDARALAPDLRTTPDFILSQPRLQFAAHIRNVTPQAVSIPVPVGTLEAQPRLSHEAYERLRELNRVRVSLPRDIPGDGFTMKGDGFADDDIKWREADDPTMPGEW